MDDGGKLDKKNYKILTIQHWFERIFAPLRSECFGETHYMIKRGAVLEFDSKMPAKFTLNALMS